MKLNAELAGSHHELSIRREGSEVFADIDGRRYELELRELDSGASLLIDNHLVFECRMSPSTSSGLFEVNVGTQNYAIRISDPKRLRRAQSASTHDYSIAEIVAPMPGKVVRVLVEVGAQVAAGDGIVVVEAMKMQNEMKSPKPGKVIALRAEIGTTVNAGEVLAVIE